MLTAGDRGRRILPSPALHSIQFVNPESRLSRQTQPNPTVTRLASFLLALLAPLALVAALLAIPVDEARADSEHPGGIYSLHCAAGIRGDLAAVVHLLGAHRGMYIRVDAKDGRNYSCGYRSGSLWHRTGRRRTPLHRAAEYGRAAIAATLIAAGANVNAEDDDDSKPLHMAGNASVASVLIAAGANVNAKNDAGWTPLHSAASRGNASVVSLLLAAGAEVNAKNDAGDTPLRRFHRNFRWSIRAAVASALIAAGGHWGEACANAAVVNPAHYNPPCLCESPNVGTGNQCAEPNNGPRGCPGLTPPKFYDAAAGECACPPGAYAHGDPAVVECHADHAPIAHNPYGYGSAITMNSHEVVSHFIAEHGLNPDEEIFISGHGMFPLLHHAARIDSDQAALALIEGGADFNRKYRYNSYSNPLSYTRGAPLHYAARHSSFQTAKALLQRGANPDAVDSDGDTPLHLVAGLSDAPENVALVSLLLDKGADPNIRNDDRWRPLDLAYGRGDRYPPRRDMMAALIAGGADWSDKCTGGAIPNEHAGRGASCVCPSHFIRVSSGACECPGHSHAQVNELCLPKDSAQVADEIEKMRLELERLRALLAELNVQLTLAADGPPEMLEEVAKQAEQAARGIARRRNNFLALARAGLAEAADAGPAPSLALSDTEATCRMLDGEVQTHSRTGAKICSGIDHNDTFCIVRSALAFPCVGFFRHVRRCNDDHNRPALDPFHCAKKCADGKRARGAKCEPES